MLRQKLKKFVYGKLPFFSGSFPYYGEKVFFPKDSFLFELACDQGVYEHANVRLLLSLVKPGTCYFDVGANIGLMALPVLRTIPECRVVSFEPSPATVPFLMKTVKNSSFSSRWQVINEAVGKEDGELDFHVARAGLGAFDGFYRTGRIGAESDTVKVRVTTIDAVWEKLGRPEISVMKIDVEGAEVEALLGAERCIATAKPYLLVEWNQSNSSAAGKTPEDMLKVAGDLNYTVYCTPYMVPVTNSSEMSAQMLFSEDFLLVPKVTTHGR
jgi:FkbM family methyltransferase